MNISDFLTLFLLKLTISTSLSSNLLLPGNGYRPVTFEISPEVKSINFGKSEHPRDYKVLPIFSISSDRSLQLGDHSGIDILSSVHPKTVETTSTFSVARDDNDSGSSDDINFLNDPNFEIIDGSGGLPDIGSGNRDTGIIFPDVDSSTSSTTTSISPSTGTVAESNLTVFYNNDYNNCSVSNGEILFRGNCQILLTRGICNEGEWLIVDKKGLPYCENRPCPIGYLLYRGKCVSSSDSSVCGTYEILYVDFFANVYCDCQPEFVYDWTDRRCYAEHDQGSCPFGQYLELDVRNKVKCVVNPCGRDDLVYEENTGICYVKLFKGSCAKNNLSILKTYSNGTADCVYLEIRNIFEVPALTSCPAGSKRDYLGNCQTVFRINTFNTANYRVPSQYTSRYNLCPPGYTKFPDGGCKKVNELFGR